MKRTAKRQPIPENWKTDPDGVPFDWFNSIGFVAKKRERLEDWLDKYFHNIPHAKREAVRSWLDNGARTPEDVWRLGRWVRRSVLPEVTRSIQNENSKSND